ncbi:MAG: hypothetical protein ACREBJ_10695 [Nitrosotalea sp.]
MRWNYVRQGTGHKLKLEASNKTMLTVLSITCIITCFVLLMPPLLTPIVTIDHLIHTTYHPNISGIITEKLTLPIEKANMYLEQKLESRNPGWIAGPAKSMP